jgi:hypothetical protein
MNGAGLRGTDPQKDMVVSNVVFLEAPTQVLFKIWPLYPLVLLLLPTIFQIVQELNFVIHFLIFSCRIVPSSRWEISGFKAITLSKITGKFQMVKITGNV